ncbi:MAG: CDP-alcohol phosphatidyltransferase family protein [Actinobacteria bacterium]|nr:CDP-alcohol phosphatidyltransferase family protein [Actinomycetota bacterium]NCW96846.1 CDP-alcohol phosphatidyltransferase family protein [Actinomycetota bacterium]NCX01134.1 CDP-alcohol phosphatidyltransferase family protein [Actinomycetota bacterium]NCX76961.1 CDP-alcohol phosphatidyltransferase family protein [Actinomycetota bacterium]
MSQRPTKPTIEQLRAVCQPPSVTGRSNAEHWVADLYLRKLSPYLTRLLLKTPITANGVTYLMIITGISISAALQIPGLFGLFLAFLLSQLQMLWDCCDGEIARWRDTQSPKGVFLDRVGHYLTESLIPIALAWRIGEGDYELLFLGSLISVLILLNKGFNDAVHVSRAYAGLPKLADSKSVGEAKSMIIRVARAPFRIFAVQRLFHSVEMSILILVFSGNENLIRMGLPLAAFVTAGHLVSILSSRKLDK